MVFFSKSETSSGHSRNQEIMVEDSGLIFPSFVKKVGNLFDFSDSQPLRHLNIVRITAVAATVALVVGIGVAIALTLLDIFIILFQ